MLRISGKLLFYPDVRQGCHFNLKGYVSAMITVGHCGYDSRHRTRLEMRRPGGTPDYTLLLIKTEAFFRIDGKLCRLRRGRLFCMNRRFLSITAA